MLGAPMMQLLSVNVSRPRDITAEGRTVRTAIFKEPVAGRVFMRTLNIDGDGQANLQVHGGIHLAVYAYPHEHYDFWARALGRNDLHFGQFGENLTVTGMTEDQVHIGDRFRIGTAVVEVTQPRVPCSKLAFKMNRPQFPKEFLASGRSGFYLRVIEEGEIGAGDPIERVHTDAGGVTVRQVNWLVHFDQENAALARRAVRLAALTPDWRTRLEEQLAKLEHGSATPGLTSLP